MQSQTSDNTGFNKLKTIISLGISCNYTTIFGSVVAWILFQHLGWTQDFFSTLGALASILPFFMGDAVNAYVLGRIKLESQNDWDDIKMTDVSKANVESFYKVYRGFSVITTYGLVAIAMLKIGLQSIPTWLPIIVAAIGLLHFIRCVNTMIKGISPIIPSYKERGLIHRAIFILISCSSWYCLCQYQTELKPSLFFIFVSGMLYFVICGLMQPLPSNGSLLGSILRDSLKAQARAESDNAAIGYTKKDMDIEDASIINQAEQEPTDGQQ